MRKLLIYIQRLFLKVQQIAEDSFFILRSSEQTAPLYSADVRRQFIHAQQQWEDFFLIFSSSELTVSLSSAAVNGLFLYVQQQWPDYFLILSSSEMTVYKSWYQFLCSMMCILYQSFWKLILLIDFTVWGRTIYWIWIAGRVWLFWFQPGKYFVKVK